MLYFLPRVFEFLQGVLSREITVCRVNGFVKYCILFSCRHTSAAACDVRQRSRAHGRDDAAGSGAREQQEEATQHESARAALQEDQSGGASPPTTAGSQTRASAGRSMSFTETL